MLKGFFHCRTAQVLFSMLHPWFAFRLGNNWSKHSRLAKSQEYTFRGKDERLYKFCETFPEPIDYFIFAHRHVPMRYELTPDCTFFNTGDWLSHFSYITFGTENPEPMLHTIS
jgi:UDP-2,3-diacylglucosamine hydrolase